MSIPTQIALHDLLLLIGALCALAAAAGKVHALRTRHDGWLWLRLLMLVASVWLGVVWLLQLTRIIPVGPMGLSYAMPGAATVLILEFAHAYVQW